MTNWLKLNIFFKIININLLFSFKNTIKNILIKSSPKIVSSCIYKIPCDNCEYLYVWFTYKLLSTRVVQHENNVRTAQENSAIFCYYRDHDHQVS